MTISNTPRKAGPYAGNGSATTFAFAFKVFSAADVLVVRAVAATGAETTLALNTDYTVSLNADQDTSPGGTITTTTAPATGQTITLSSDMDYTQPVELTNNGGFYPRVINDALDRSAIQVQQLDERMGRTLTLPLSVPSAVDSDLPLPVANAVIGWNSSGTGLQNVSPSTLATIVSSGTSNADTFSGDGVTTTFALSANPGALNNLDVSIDGVVQSPGADYLWSGGTTLTFTSAPPAGSGNILARYIQALPQGTADWNALTNSPIVDVRRFGAVGDGVVNDTTSIQAAIDHVSANGGGSVFVPSGVYRVSQLLLKSYVSLVGVRSENGWARLVDYNKGSVIKSLDNSGLSTIKVVSPSINWGIQNLVIDANKTAQTHPGVHCVEHTRSSATSSPGGLIENCKLVNATGWGAYIIAAHPLEITNTFIMSGLYLGRNFDTLVTGCSIDGTDSKHPALWMAQTEHCTVDGCLIFRGESVSQTVSQTYTVDTANDWITVSDDSVFYDGMPVVLSAGTTYPQMTDSLGTGVSRGKDSYVVKKLGSNRLALYYRYDNPSSDTRIYFVTAGVGTQTISSGVTDIVHVTAGFHNRISDCRVAGSPGGAVNIALSTYIQYDNCDQWGLNWDNSSTQPAITVHGSQYCTVTGVQAGDSSPPSGKTRVREAIYVVDDNSAPAGSVQVSQGNIFSANQYNLTQGVYVNDVSTASYENRNLIDGWEGAGGITTARIVSPTFKSTPGVYYYSAAPTSAQAIPTSPTVTNIAWTAVASGNPRGVTDGSSLVFPNTANSLINVNGVITTNRLSGTYNVLVYVNINGVLNRFYEVAEVSGTNPSLITIPFNVSQVLTADATVVIQVFHTQGTDLTLSNGSNLSRLCVTKVADYIA